jgi:hypothetical protein
MKSICVYCSSSNDIDARYAKDAGELGALIASGGYRLIYGGGMIGLMGILAKSVQKHGGAVTGIIPKTLAQKGIMYESAEELIETPDLRKRKELMEERADAFIALPGGFGTLEEIAEIITLKQLKHHEKPVVFINTNNFFSHLLAHFEKCFEEKFMSEKYRKLYTVANTPREGIAHAVERLTGL